MHVSCQLDLASDWSKVGHFHRVNFLRHLKFVLVIRPCLALWDCQGCSPQTIGGPPLVELAIAPKRIYISIWKFLTFLLYQKPKFWRRKKSDFFTPSPLRRGVLKIWKFWKLVGEPNKLLNMICSTIKIRPADKISVLYLQNQSSYGNVNLMRNLRFTKFLTQILRFRSEFCMWPLII